MLRAIKTALMGYKYCSDHKDENIRKHKNSFKKRLKMMRYFLAAATIFVQNRKSEYLLREVKDLYRLYFGGPGISVLAASSLVVLLSFMEYLRCRIFGDNRNPKTSCIKYNESRRCKGYTITNEVANKTSSELIFSVPKHFEQ